MKKKPWAAFLLPLLLVLFCAYAPNQNINIRFGNPGGKGTLLMRKGYAVNYHLHKKYPIWVSYHLDKKKATAGKKVKALYLKDPMIAPKAQPKESDFNVKNYYKGRMAPLLDMQMSKGSLKEAQYITNIALRHSGLMQRWTVLEDKIRAFAATGKDVWVIAGPVYDKTGEIRKTKTGLEIPTHFFKIVIFQNREFEFVAAAFLFENRYGSKPPEDYIVEIITVEKITGLQFLSSFPEEVGKSLKTRRPKPEKLDFIK
jgi:endonuclease G, mitochondrial